MGIRGLGSCFRNSLLPLRPPVQNFAAATGWVASHIPFVVSTLRGFAIDG